MFQKPTVLLSAHYFTKKTTRLQYTYSNIKEIFFSTKKYNMWETFQELPHKILWFLEYHSGKKQNPLKISPFCKFLLTEKRKLCIMLKRSSHGPGRN